MKISSVYKHLFGIGIVTSFVLATTLPVQAQVGDYKYYFDLYGVEVINAPGVEIEYPSWAKPNPEQNITDLSYWVNEVLPYSEDRNATKYIVYPKHGVVVPVVLPSASDQALIDKGEMFNHYPYLEKGALHYFGYDPHQGYGNMVIAGHSSFNKSAAGHYKTTFQVLPISKAGDKIFIYLKNKEGSFDFFEYTITESFRTNKYDVGVMTHTPDEYTLTTYGCYVIGSNEERWINKAKLSTKKLAHSTIGGMHASASDAPSEFIGDTSSTTQPTNNITQQILARKLAHAYDTKNTEKSPEIANEVRLTISQQIAARMDVQVRDAQNTLSPSPTEAKKEHAVAATTVTNYSPVNIFAELLRPKMSLHQEILLNNWLKRNLTSRSPEQRVEFIEKLATTKEDLKGATDKVSLRKEVVISYLLEKLQK